jgi:hypothetical protein
MALVKDGEVVTVGLPQNLRSIGLPELKAMGWKVVTGRAPDELPEPGYQWDYGAPWSVDGDNVVGTFSQVKQPQPYPSWSWVDGEGWVAPKPKPDGEYEWNEDTGKWTPISM